jgi:lipopolysaccharide/colanic/teichoic acid biosynthesis glycosyltransferase
MPEARRLTHGWENLGECVLAGALVVFTFPLMVIVALAIKFDSPGPVFSRRERRGPRGRHFVAVKFRTTVNAHEPHDGVMGVADPDRRVTRIGWFLRYTRIDSLPQLINAVRGDMRVIRADTSRPHFLD